MWWNSDCVWKYFQTKIFLRKTILEIGVWRQSYIALKVPNKFTGREYNVTNDWKDSVAFIKMSEFRKISWNVSSFVWNKQKK